MEPQENYYFTFMLRQGPLKNKYVKIFDTYNSARRKMIEMFGDNWGFQYSEKEFTNSTGFSNSKELEL